MGHFDAEHRAISAVTDWEPIAMTSMSRVQCVNQRRFFIDKSIWGSTQTNSHAGTRVPRLISHLV